MNDDQCPRQAEPQSQCSVCSSLILCCELGWWAGAGDGDAPEIINSHNSPPHTNMFLSLSPRPSPSCPWCQWCHPSPGLYVSVISLQSPSCHPWHIHDITPPLWRQQSDVAPGWRCCLEASLPELGSLARCDDGAGGVDWRGAQS